MSWQRRLQKLWLVHLVTMYFLLYRELHLIRVTIVYKDRDTREKVAHRSGKVPPPTSICLVLLLNGADTWVHKDKMHTTA